MCWSRLVHVLYIWSFAVGFGEMSIKGLQLQRKDGDSFLADMVVESYFVMLSTNELCFHAR
jgi:hypothetical protein